MLTPQSRTIDIQSSDEALILAYREGQDALAYSELVRRYQIPIYRILSALLSDPDEAEPACERLFVRAASRIDELDDPADFHTWLIELAGSVADETDIDRITSRPRITDPAALASDQGKQVVADAVREALGHMDSQQRTMLTLVELEGNAPVDVAAAMGMRLAEFEPLLEVARTRFVDLLTNPPPVPHPPDPLAATDDPDADPSEGLGQPPALLGGRYRMLARLGEGGMAVVHRAEDTQTNEAIAIKLVHLGPGSNDLRSRFEREATAMKHVDHPHFVGLHGSGEVPGAMWMALELIEGRNLADRLTEGPMPPLQALSIARQLVSALGHLHQLGIVHRDVKSDNVLFVREGESPTVKLIDLGIARLPESIVGPAPIRLTAAGMTLGTPAYIAPEQAIAKNLDGRADLYSLSVLLFEMLTGKLPFRAGDMVTLLTMHVSTAPPLVSDLAPSTLQVPEALDELVDRGLAKAAAERYADADDYLEHLDAVTSLLR